MKGVHKHLMMTSLAMCWMDSEYIPLCIERGTYWNF